MSGYLNWMAFLVTNCPDYSSVQLRNVYMRVTETTFNVRTQTEEVGKQRQLRKRDLLRDDDSGGKWVIDAAQVADPKKNLNQLVGGAAPGTGLELIAGFAMDPPGVFLANPPRMSDNSSFVLEEDYFTHADFETFIFSGAGTDPIAIIAWGYSAQLFVWRSSTSSTTVNREFRLVPDVTQIFLRGKPSDAFAYNLFLKDLKNAH